MTKEELRKSTIKKRDSLSDLELSQKSRSIFEKLIESPLYSEAKNVLIYSSMKSEVRTDEIILDCLAQGKNVFCPKCTDTKNGIMEFIKIDSLEDLQEGYYGIREPLLTEKSIVFGKGNQDYLQDSLLIAPCVAFDKEGNRIGYGGGYYDRFLERFPTLSSLALAFMVQQVDSIPAAELDEKIGSVITE